MNKTKSIISENSIDEGKLEKLFSSSKAAIASNVQPDNTNVRRQRIIQNFLLIWLDPNIDESSDDFKNAMTHLQRVVNTIKIFTDADECVDYLTEVAHEKVFLIVSGALGQSIIPSIHAIPQLDCIYMLCDNKFHHEQWMKSWHKMKGVFTEISPIYDAFKIAVRKCEQDSVSISCISASAASNQNLAQLDPSFMWTQLLKEILLEINFDKDQCVMEFTDFCHEQYVDVYELNSIKKFALSYIDKSPICWYTQEYFLYSMLNRALRTFEVDTIVKMGFFIRDLHQHIEQLHLQQFGSQNVELLTVYRGQCLSIADFEKLMKTKGGLMSFNNFLSTSIDRDVALAFAESNTNNPNMIGVLFVITINSSASSAVFASLDDVSYYQENEKEILFSMHTVFRICDIEQICGNPCLWRVGLTLTNDNDQQLNAITKRMRSEIYGTPGWCRLGELLIRLAKFDMAETLCQTLLNQATNDNEKLEIYDELGRIMDCKGNHKEALAFYEKLLHADQKNPNLNNYNLANSYHNIALVHCELGQYLEALSFNEKSLEIKQTILPPNHPQLAYSYHNIGLLYSNMNDHLKALSFYEIALEIWQKSLPSYHPDLGSTYNNIGSVYTKMGEFSTALSFHEKAFEIRQKSLPENHPDLALSYSNIGEGYSKVDNYSKALSSYEKLLQIQQKTVPVNHLNVADTYNNIGLMYEKIGEYWKALSFFEKALEIRQKSLPPNHFSLSTSYHNIGNVYSSMGDDLKAVTFFERSINIAKHSLAPNDPLRQKWERFQKDQNILK